jgi:outer membrane protein TolC
MSSPFTAHFQARHAVLRCFPRIALATLVGVLCTAAFAVEAPLTLPEAQQLAIERSRQLSAKDHAVMASREMAVAAGQLPDPVLKIGVDNLPVEGADRFSIARDFMTMRRVGVMQEWTRADKRQLRAERFEREAEKSVAEKVATTAAIQRDTALAWLDRYYAEAMAAVIAEQAAQAKLEIQAAEGAYRAGRGNQADIFAARSALVAIDDRASDIQRRIRNAKTMLARWIGDAAETPLAGKPSIDAVALDAATLDMQLAHHPEIAVLTKQEEIAATEARLAQANKKTDWSVELAFQQRGPAYPNMISVGVSIPLQWGQKNRQDRELSSKLATVEQARAEREDTLRAHVAEVRSMMNEWENNRERHARYEREFIPLANARTGAAIAAYRGGKSSLADVLAARRNEIDVRLQALQLETDTARLWAQLNFLYPQDGALAHSTMRMNKDSK